jgi:glutamate/tyrosine decarboxylase-like PLP-dependent enzyme
MRKDFTGPLNAAMRSALEYLERLDDRPVGPTASLEELRQRFCREWNAEGAEPKQVIEELVRAVNGGLNNSASARFYAWVIGGTLPSALAADWMTSTWDQNAGMYTVSPASAVVEEAVGEWLKQLFHLPKQTSFALVTGCQMAHTTCLAAARSWLLKQHGWDVELQGMAGSPAITVLCGVRHATIDRTLRLLGFGDASIQTVRTKPEALEAVAGAFAGRRCQHRHVRQLRRIDSGCEKIQRVDTRRRCFWHVGGGKPALRASLPRNAGGALLGH